ncbi:GGDEF domain-containing protein [Alteromonas abrolhosensis]|uniref:GGDEF domain-containing protein n=1 Tax=Alteromonas abrolhosensis TaxID=1892904 RepID=UPI002D21CB03|nr:diguanylate cyclase [Alteromonas abrolhosensis]
MKRTNPLDVNRKFIDITVSAGVSCVKEHHDTVESALSEADDALYKAKRTAGIMFNWPDNAIEIARKSERNSTECDLGANCARTTDNF